MNIVITGASRGIGYHTALHFTNKRENKIFALSRNEKGLIKLTSANSNQQIIPIVCDITNEESLKSAVDKITQRVDGIDVLIHNAGLLINKPFSDLTLKDWKLVYDVNVFGVVDLTRMLLPLLKKGKISGGKNIKSHIVNITSMGGVQGSTKFKGLSAYSSSKGAMITITECLAEEFNEFGIRVNALALGSVETEMFKAAFPGVKSTGTPEEIAEWIGDFATKSFSYFQGKCLELSVGNP